MSEREEWIKTLSDHELFQLRSVVTTELRARGLAANVGEAAEALAIALFARTPGMPNLQAAPTGTQNVDALSRTGDRYSIKGIVKARKTGTVYPDRENPDRQLFEYLLIVKLDSAWQLEGIYELDWQKFCALRSWDSRMNAWYVGYSQKMMSAARVYLPKK